MYTVHRGLHAVSVVLVAIAINAGRFSAAADPQENPSGPSTTPTLQRSARPLIGYLCTHDAWIERYREALAEVGYVDGRNVTLLWRGGDQHLGELSKLADELVNLRVKLILTDSTTATLAAQRATTTIPIVFAHVADPVRFGLVESLARPGRNITGITLMTLDVTAKRLELLKQAVPKLSRVVVLWNPTNPIGEVQVQDAENAASQLGLKVRPAAVREVADLSKVFASIGNQKQTAILVTDDNFFWNELHRIAALSMEYGLPAIAGTRLFPAAQGLLSYGASPKEQYYHAAVYVDKILKGAKPAELPVERATKFELVVNASTAKALEVSMPQSILVRADEVIR
jgi:ABC-type uncharacterized transport system substrate-binding protein